MENYEIPTPITEPAPPERLTISSNATQDWKKTSNWAIFLGSIMLLVSLAYLCATVFFALENRNLAREGIHVRAESVIILLTLCVATLVMMASAAYQLLFGLRIKSGIASRNQNLFDSGWSHFLNHLRISGIAFGLMTLFYLGITVMYVYLAINMMNRY